MQPLVKLWLMKQKATIRNLFRKPSSAIFTVLMVLVYGGLFITMLFSDSFMSASIHDLHNAVMLSLGFAAMFVISLLWQKRKALFYEADSFYLFSGPYTRAQIMRYLMGQTLLQAVLFSLLCVFMLVCFGGGIAYTPFFLISCIFGFILLFSFFLIFTDYLYILSITNEKYKKLSHVTIGVFVFIIFAIFMVTLAQNHFVIRSGLTSFVESDLFYFVPLFGWLKWLLIASMQGEVVIYGIALALLLGANIVLYRFFISFKGDFYEQAMMDSIELSQYMQQVKAGKQNAMKLNAKVHSSKVRFRLGAGAIFSKNFLIMKKTRDFLRIQEIAVIVFYFVVSLFTGLGFGMFCYMLIIWIFQTLQTCDLMQELKNYQIYLIPAKPLQKLWYAMLPTLLKLSILIIVSVVGSGVFFRMPFAEILQYCIMLLGYTMVFLSATVLSIRLLKSRSNMFVENLLRMLIILVCSLPSVALILIIVVQQGIYDLQVITLISNLSLLMNFIVSFLIIFFCKGMMNGRELDSD